MFGLGRWYVLAQRLRRLLGHWIVRYVLSWLLAIGVAWLCTANAWDNFKNDKRPDGNAGHTAIDFGGQWIMGRMLVTGQSHFLYESDYIRNELGAGYPQDQEVPGQETHDVDGIMGSFMTAEHTPARHVQGPLYPPINAFVYYPLGLLPPQLAYRMMQIALLGFALLAGWGIQRLTQGRIWLPLATALLIAFPGFSGAQCLGQNSPITLSILIWGWVLLAAGRSAWAGVVWGLLAFKPVWALAFFLVPVLSRRWRMCLAMAATGLLQIALTLPWVGIDTWRDWFAVGKAGAEHYKSDSNWIQLSRDLLGIPRRLMLDFQKPFDERDLFEPAIAGWALLVFVLESTIRLAILRRNQIQAVTGPAPAFLLLGAWLSCYHFMYYDVLLTALPVLLLFTRPREYLEPGFLAWEPLVLWDEPLLMPWQTVGLLGHVTSRVSKGTVSFLALPAANYGWIWNPFAILVLVALVANEQVLEPHGWLSIQEPWDTLAALALWGWCGWLWTRQHFAGQKAERAYGELPITAVDVDR